jgi:macrodomain Ter protein organizer (MatP/YcbG family)
MMINIILILIFNREVYVSSYQLKDVDDKLWKEVKILAIRKGMTIQELIVELLEKAVKKGVV